MAKTRQLISYHHNGVEPSDIMDSDIKTYKTLAGLQKALEDNNIHEDRHMIVWTETGRVTAIFSGSNFQVKGISYLGYYAQKGFLTYS